MNINHLIDATNLKPNSSHEEIEKLCHLAMEHQFASVCVAPTYADICSKLLSKSTVKRCAVVGFPYGYSFLETKCTEIRQLIAEGIQEIDFVINLTYISNQSFDKIDYETASIVSICRENGIVSKWIIECDYTRPYFDQIVQIANRRSPDFVKTSTGLLGGAQKEDIVFLKNKLNDSIKIKASGGIQTLEQAIACIDAGADRIGTSNPLFL